MGRGAYENLRKRVRELDRELLEKELPDLEEEKSEPTARIYDAVADLARACADAVIAGDEEKAMDCLDFMEYIQDVGIRIERKIPSDNRLLYEVLNSVEQKRGIGEERAD